MTGERLDKITFQKLTSVVSVPQSRAPVGRTSLAESTAALGHRPPVERHSASRVTVLNRLLGGLYRVN